MNSRNFISLCVAGQASAEDVDTYVERWHRNQIGQDQDLAECLGMNAHEYDSWVRDPAKLPAIIAAHAARPRG